MVPLSTASVEGGTSTASAARSVTALETNCQTFVYVVRMVTVAYVAAVCGSHGGDCLKPGPNSIPVLGCPS